MRRSVCVFLLASLALAACGGGGTAGSGTQNGGDTGGPAEPTTDPASIDPCNLVTNAEAREVFGGPVDLFVSDPARTIKELSGGEPVPPQLKDHTIRQCRISRSGQALGELNLGVLAPTISHDDFVANYHFVVANTRGEDEVSDSIEGLGEAAFMSTHAASSSVQIWVLEKGILLVFGGSPERAMRRIAEIALGRI